MRFSYRLKRLIRPKFTTLPIKRSIGPMMQKVAKYQQMNPNEAHVKAIAAEKEEIEVVKL